MSDPRAVLGGMGGYLFLQFHFFASCVPLGVPLLQCELAVMSLDPLLYHLG